MEPQEGAIVLTCRESLEGGTSLIQGMHEVGPPTQEADTIPGGELLLYLGQCQESGQGSSTLRGHPAGGHSFQREINKHIKGDICSPEDDICSPDKGNALP